MATLDHPHGARAIGAAASRMWRTVCALPPTFFSIPFGLAGLAGAWRLAAGLVGLPTGIADALYLLAAAVYLPLSAAFVAGLVRAPHSALTALRHPVLSPFNALPLIVGMLLALGLQPYTPGGARALFLVFFTATWLLGGWLTGEWILAPRELDQLHPGYFLPTGAGGLIGAQGAAACGLVGLGWLSFGAGIVSWLFLGAILLGRLVTRPRLPAVLLPTLAITIAPPVVAGAAYSALSGGRVDMLAYGLAGFALLMVLVQLRLLPVYRRLPFTPTFWSFTFSWAAAAIDALHWIALERPAGAAVLASVTLAAISTLVGGIALRSLIALRRGMFLPPAPTTAPTPAPPVGGQAMLSFAGPRPSGGVTGPFMDAGESDA